MNLLNGIFVKGRSLACTALVAGMLSASGAWAAQDTVKIGLILDMTGVYSDIAGKGTARAAQLAIDDFGGKVLGKDVKLLVADHQAKADIAAAKAREWFDVEKVDTIQDVTGSAAALAVLNIAREKNKILVLSGPSADKITNELCGPAIIHYAYDSYSLANTVARAGVRAGGKKWYFITADYAGGHDIVKAATDALVEEGGKVVGSTTHPLGASDFSSLILQAQNSGADTIGLASFGNDLVNVIKTAREFGMKAEGKQKLASLLMYVNDVHALGLETAQGMMLSEGFYWDMNEETRAFSKRYFESVKAMPNMSQAATYSSVLHYLKSVQAAGTTETGAVMKKMRELPIQDFYTKNGKIREDGRMVHDMYLFQVKTPAESKYPWDYFKLVATVPGDQAFKPLSKSTCPLIKK